MCFSPLSLSVALKLESSVVLLFIPSFLMEVSKHRLQTSLIFQSFRTLSQIRDRT